MESFKCVQTGRLVLLVKVTWFQGTVLEIEDVIVMGSGISKYAQEK